MPTCIQFNPSTLKIIRDNATGHVQAVGCDLPSSPTFSIYPCPYCPYGKTPAQIQVTFANIASCNDVVYFGPTIACGAKFTAASEAVINAAFVVDQSGDTCIWDTTFAAAMPIDWYDYVAPDWVFRETVNHDLRIYANRLTLVIRAQFNPSGGDCSHSANITIFTGVLSPDEGTCVQETGITESAWSACGIWIDNTGTADIVEV